MGKRRSAGIGACVALLLVATACGSDDNNGSASSTGAKSGSGCPSGVKQELQTKLGKYRAVPAFEAPGPAFDASKAQGKKIFNIPLLSTDTFNQIVDKASEKAAKAAGVQFVQYNNE